MDFDWNLVRSFVAVGETGTLSAAARQLRSSQPTVGRHIDELETALGQKLFLRGRRGYELTEQGAALMARGQAAATEMDALARQAAGADRHMAGPVRIAASEVMSAFVLPEILARLAAEEPLIEIELVASDRVENLLRRDADIALRMVRPAQKELVAKKIADIPLTFAASSSYLDRKGRPQSLADLTGHDLIGFDRSDAIVKGFAAMGLTLGASAFRLRTDNQIVYFNALCAGMGIGLAQAQLVARTPALEAFLPDVPLPSLPLWIAMHRDVKASPRIRRVADALEAGLRAYVSNR